MFVYISTVLCRLLILQICDQYCDEDYDSVAHALLVAISEKQMSFKEVSLDANLQMCIVPITT